MRKKSKNDPEAVDAYLAALPKAEREALGRLHTIDPLLAPSDLNDDPSDNPAENALATAELGVATLLTGSVQRAGGQVRFQVALDDPAHGRQQLVLFHGYFGQYQYFPSFITCADNDQVVMLSLRPGAVHAALGADDDLAYLVTRLRQAWPHVRICVRGDAGYGMPWMYAASAAPMEPGRSFPSPIV